MKADSLKAKPGQVILADRGLLSACLFGVIVPLGTFGWLAEAVRNKRNLPWDAAILKFLHSISTSPHGQIMDWAAQSGRIEVVVVFAVSGVLVLKHKRRLRDAFFLTLAIVGVVITNLLVRTVVQRTYSTMRGTFAPTFESGFPSSQAADTLAVVLVFAILAWPTCWRWSVILPGIFYVLACTILRTSWLAGTWR